MTTDDFAEAASVAANERFGTAGNREVWMEAAEWARTHLAAHDARVKRDAAREALDGLAEAMMDTPGIGPGTKTHRARMRVDVVTYRDRNYPETEDQT